MSKICKNCATDNDDKFSYCKNCGTPLDATEKIKIDQNYGYNPYNYSNPIPQEIDGIQTKELGMFVHSNRTKIIDKFSKMSITGSKLSWCWPAAILSMFFGFFGAAIWLFYRKMYKYGVIALAVAVIVLGFNTVITYEPTVNLFEQSANAFYELKGSTPDFQGFYALLSEAFTQFASTPQTMLSTYCATIIYGLFGMYLYKKHSLQKITEYRSINKDSEYYAYGIRAIGGTSAGMAVLAIIITVVIQNLISSIPILAFILF